MKQKITPTKAGLYWARANVTGWFNLIVNVEGEAPMLTVTWALRLSGLDAPKLIAISPTNIDEWDLTPIIPPHERKNNATIQT